MRISEAARRSGLTAKTIRYYEQIGLLSAGRRDNGYRDYDAADVDRLAFLASAREIGFSIEECRALLSLHDDPHRASCEVRDIAAGKLADLDRRLEKLRAMRRRLARLTDACRGDDSPDCPIIEDLSGRRDAKAAAA